jgi:CubicO group peptidase (beta-lactamase class C family)
MRGEVHDITAYTMGGAAGDAGLFSTASDLATFMQFHLQGGVTKRKERVFSERTVSTFYTRVDGLPYENRRALGWDTVPIQEYPPCGHLFSLNSFGHTGYTGTMMWADRDRGLIVIFLTNRVYPSDIDITIRKVRTLLSDAIIK